MLAVRFSYFYQSLTAHILPICPLGCPVYSISLLGTLNAREGLRMQAENFADLSLPQLSRTSNSISRRSVRAVVDAMVRPDCPGRLPRARRIS